MKTLAALFALVLVACSSATEPNGADVVVVKGSAPHAQIGNTSTLTLTVKNDGGSGSFYVEVQSRSMFSNAPGIPNYPPEFVNTPTVNLKSGETQTLSWTIHHSTQYHIVYSAKVYSDNKLTSCWGSC